MQTLYVSDLDGTLLNEAARLSDFSVDILNRLMDKGLSFTIATARSSYSVVKLMRDVRFTLPMLLMNGVLVYDPLSSRVMEYWKITSDAASRVIALLKNESVFLYWIEEGILRVGYERLDSQWSLAFKEERVREYEKRFTQVEDLRAMLDKEILYFTLIDTESRLRPLYDTISRLDGVTCAFYADNYHEGIWYLEIFSADASKANAVLWLKERENADKLVCFGDNFNDLPMFEVCDESYAVSSARDEVKARATGVIGSNVEDGVVRWLESKSETAAQGE